MPFVEAIWLALAQIRVQKLKSFFTLLGVTIGVMFLIAVISIVQGMSSYMENDFAAKLLPDAARRKLFSENARTFYRLPATDGNV